MKNRRELLQMSLLAGGALFAAPALLRGRALESFLPDADSSEDPWNQLPAILERIKPPVFPDRSFKVTKFGAVGNNKTDNTEPSRRQLPRACKPAAAGLLCLRASSSPAPSS